MVVNIHGGGGIPDYGDAEVARAIMLVELPWFSHRSVWHLIFGGVFERHPALQVVLTEQGLAWLPRGLETLDWFYGRMTLGDAAEANFFGAAAKGMSMTPTEYFQRNVSVGASFLRASESALRHEVGVERIMWGADYPHSEGSYPFSREALRAAFGTLRPGRDPADGRGQRGRSLRVRPRRPPIHRRTDRADRGRGGDAPPGRGVPGRLHLQRLRPPPGAALVVGGRASGHGPAGAGVQPGGWSPYSAFHQRAPARSAGSLRLVASWPSESGDGPMRSAIGLRAARSKP